MGKKIVEIAENKKECFDIKKALGSQCLCYVLITCFESSEEGKMDVEMTFEGEESLAAFLIDNASQVFDDRMSHRESK